MAKRFPAALALLLVLASPLWAQKTSSPGPQGKATAGSRKGISEEESEEKVVAPEKVLKIRPRRGEIEKFDIDRELTKKAFIYKKGIGRDPLKTPLTERALRTKAAPGKGAKSVAGQKLTPAQLRDKQKFVKAAQEEELAQQNAMLIELQSIKEGIESQLKSPSVDEKAVLKLNEEFGRKLEAAQAKVTDPELRRRFRRLVLEHQNIRPRLIKILLKHFAGQIREKAAAVTRDFELEDYPRVVARAKEIAEYVDKNNDLLAADPDVAAEVLKTMSRIATLGRKAAVRMEFAKKTFVVTGINWSPNMAMAILNGTIDVSVGTVVDDVHVAKITPNSVVLDYKGELFEKPFFD